MPQEIRLGLDIGGTYIKAAAIAGDQEIEKIRISSRAQTGPLGVRAAIGEVLEYFSKKNLRPSFLGLGCAGGIDSKKGVVRNSPNFAGWKDIPLVQWIQEDHGLPVTLDNDANCAVLGEWKLGSAQGKENVVMLTFGTGIGGGLILNNSLYCGATGTAGELGHFSIHVEGPECACGHRGCFERYCSARALEAKHPGKKPREIFSSVHEEPYATTVNEFLSHLEKALTTLANIFDPHCFVFGGAVSDSIIPYRNRLLSYIKAHAFPAVGECVDILPSQFGPWSGAIGAAYLSPTCSR